MDTPADSHEETRIKPERRQELEHHLKQSPTDRDAFLELGSIYRAENRPLDAKRVLAQARDVFPEDMTILWELEEATLARSLQQYREFTDLAKKLETAEAEREVQRSANDWALRRIEICGARISRDPSLLHLHISRAEAMLDLERYLDAIKEVQPVLNHEEHSPVAHLILGRALLAKGEDAKAMTALRAASLRRAVVSPIKVRVAALRLLCATAERLGVQLTLGRYRESLLLAEQELADNSEALGAANGSSHPTSPSDPSQPDSSSV